MYDDNLELDEVLARANARLRAEPQLAGTAPFSRRTYHYYVQRGLLPGSGGRRGPGTRYPASLVERLVEIRRLQTMRHLSLAEIRLVLDAPAAPSVTSGQRPPAPPVVGIPDMEPAAPEGPAEDDAAIPVLTAAVSTPMKDLLEGASRGQSGEAEGSVGAGEFTPGPSMSLRQALPDALTEAPDAAIRCHELAPGVELVVRRPLSPRQARQLKSVEALLRTILEEEPVSGVSG